MIIIKANVFVNTQQLEEISKQYAICNLKNKYIKTF